MNGQVPLLGQQQAQAAQVAQQLFLCMYVPLLPQLAVYRMAHGYDMGSGIREDATPRRIAEEAKSIVEAGLEQLEFSKAE